MTTTPHGRSRYTKGCRCGICREANREYQRHYRAKPLRAVPDTAAEVVSSAVPGGLQRLDNGGVVAEAVQRQLDALGAVEARPGMAAIALRLAELLDNPLALPQHPAAAGRLVELLGRLSKEQQRRGRLTAVRDMTHH